MRIVCLASLLLLMACGGGVYKVSEDPESGGVPFLPIISMDVTSMTFEQRWAEVELSTIYEPELSEPAPAASKPAATAEGKKPDKGAPAPASSVDKGTTAAEGEPRARFKTRQIRYLTDIAYANSLLKAFNEENTPIAASEKLNLRFKKDPDNKLGLEEPAPLSVEDALKLPLASIERRRDQVPGTKPLYINVPVAPAGSGNAAVELNMNGTLARATGNTKNELANIIGKTVGSVVSSIHGAPGARESVGGVPVVDSRMRVTIVRRVYLVTLRRPSENATPCNIAALLHIDPVVAPPPDAGACSASLSVVVVRGEDIDKASGASDAPPPGSAPDGDAAPAARP